MQEKAQENAYLGQVLEKQARVDQELRRKARHARPEGSSGRTGGAEPAAGRAVDYRITGFWRWRTVVVPPNVYVVHTRRGHREPLTVGLGLSFRFDPFTDSFLVVPAAMQTIVINANCICIERQGILVQAYVQWIVDDIQTAYRKVDFSDPEDPMGIVNVQLREQAEAAIKDKVATMSIDDVLSDKQPIIEELTHRLRVVAEGSREAGKGEGLGLKIVTVQIKEAVVSSTRLWEHIQTPFRAEREKLAKIAALEAAQQIDARELLKKTQHARSVLEAEAEEAVLAAQKERERYDREEAERERRHTLEQEAERRTISERNDTQKAAKDAALLLLLKDHEVEARRIDSDLAVADARRSQDAAEAARTEARSGFEQKLLHDQHQAECARRSQDLVLRRTERAIDNELSPHHLQDRIVAQLPDIARALPKPAELRSITIGGEAASGPMTQLLGLLAGALSLAEKPAKPPET